PEGFASILYKDASLASEAASAMKITAQDLINYGIIDRIIKEPLGGAHTNVDEMSISIKRNLEEAIGRLKCESIESLLTKRYYKFRKIGKVVE
ncbi:acetyl-CoA carboxylase carboxyl transferase subunit alpha, partial [Clostridium estertheticum]|nr:acetyl-CoA carboxylase carboxyl transferase subunit alpha [Clostridium estertheticum]